MFDGEIAAEGEPAAFFSGNSFYTTAANRIARGVLPNAVTVGDVIAALGGGAGLNRAGGGPEAFWGAAVHPAPGSRSANAPASLSPEHAVSEIRSANVPANRSPEHSAPESRSANTADASANRSHEHATDVSANRSPEHPASESRSANRSPEKRKKTRPITAAAITFAAIALTIGAGSRLSGGRRYYLISLLIMIEAALPFILSFERRKPQAREIAAVAALTAAAAAGRAAFFMAPEFKPAAAVVIIAGAAFGGEAGFLVGALSAFVSNLFFGQGPWTPWQMFAFGIIGFLAGAFTTDKPPRSSFAAAAFGGVAAFAVYGAIMNPAALLIYQQNPTPAMLLTSFAQGLPFDAVHGFSTALFLLIAYRPVIKKLSRIKVKHGIFTGHG
jgi:energy-coupling factor transport system ATP-binding protein